MQHRVDAADHGADVVRRAVDGGGGGDLLVVLHVAGEGDGAAGGGDVGAGVDGRAGGAAGGKDAAVVLEVEEAAGVEVERERCVEVGIDDLAAGYSHLATGVGGPAADVRLGAEARE